MAEELVKSKPVAFFSRGVSSWKFEETEDAGGFKVLAAAYQSGTLVVRDPKGVQFKFSYRGGGVGAGVEIHLPMWIRHNSWLLIKLSGLTKIARKRINLFSESVGAGSNAGGGYLADRINQALPDVLHPSTGVIFCGPGLSSDDLRPEDFEGWCIFCNVDAGLVFGTSGTGMLIGLSEVRHSWLKQFLLNAAPMGPLIKAMEAFAQAKALIFFAGSNLDFRVGGGAAALIGYISKAVDIQPSGDIFQLEMEMLNPTLTSDGREVT